MEKIPVLAVVGPTASGKTRLSVELAKEFEAEIISFDSMQLYKTMDVATAKPTVEEMQGIKHHLVDVIDPSVEYSVAKFKEDADAIASDISARGSNIVMVGGTGLYIDTFINNIQFLESEGNEEIREKLKAELLETGPEAMHEKLREIDPESAEKINFNNTGRVLRALEVYYLTGYTMSYQVANSKLEPSRYEPLYIGISARDRDVLYNRINLRVDLMIENGLLDEAREYLDSNIGNTASQAIGIKEMIPYLKGEKTLEECAEQLKTDTRHYAKRQLTWFRRNENVHWLFLDDYDSFDDLVGEAVKLVKQSGIFD